MPVYFPLVSVFYGIAVMAIAVDFQFPKLSHRRQAGVFFYLVMLAAGNIAAIRFLGSSVYEKFYLFFAQLPVYAGFFIFSPYRGIKLFFVLLSTVVFTTPPILCRIILRSFFQLPQGMYLVLILASYLLMILFVWKFIKEDFNYMLENCEDRHFWAFCIVPFLGYIYTYAISGYHFENPINKGTYWMRLLPSLIVFSSYILLIRIFRITRESQRLETEKNMMQMQIDGATRYLHELKHTQEQAVLYRHDMRHHLALIDRFAAEGNTAKIREYLAEILELIQNITPRHYCENETANQIFTSFSAKAEAAGVVLSVDASLPLRLNLDETELCVLLSNALENAITAAAKLEQPALRQVTLRAFVENNSLLISTKNAYTGTLVMEDGFPKTERRGHGFGIRSMAAIAEDHGGLFGAETSDGYFLLRLIVPLENPYPSSLL